MQPRIPGGSSDLSWTGMRGRSRRRCPEKGDDLACTERCPRPARHTSGDVAKSLSSPPKINMPPATATAASAMKPCHRPVIDCWICSSGASQGRPPPDLRWPGLQEGPRVTERKVRQAVMTGSWFRPLVIGQQVASLVKALDIKNSSMRRVAFQRLMQMMRSTASAITCCIGLAVASPTKCSSRVKAALA